MTDLIKELEAALGKGTPQEFVASQFFLEPAGHKQWQIWQRSKAKPECFRGEK